MSNYRQVGSYDALRQAGGDAPRDPQFYGQGRAAMGYLKGEAERERLRGEIARVEANIKQARARGEEVVAQQYEQNALRRLQSELAGVKDADISHLFQNGKCVQCGCDLNSKKADEKCPKAKEPYK